MTACSNGHSSQCAAQLDFAGRLAGPRKRSNSSSRRIARSAQCAHRANAALRPRHVYPNRDLAIAQGQGSDQGVLGQYDP